MDVRRKGGHNNALVSGLREQRFKGLADGGLTGRVAGLFGVGGIRQVTEDPLFTEFGEPGKVNHLSVNGRGVNLEVTRVDDGSGVTGQCIGQGIRNGVVDVDGFNVECAEAEGVAGLNFVEFAFLENAMLFQLALNETDGQPRGIDRRLHLLEQERKASDVVFVAVGNDDAADTVGVAEQIGKVRNDKVHAEHVGFRERGTTVQKDNVSVVLEHGHILADFVESADKADADGLMENGFVRCFRLLFRCTGCLFARSFSGTACSISVWHKVPFSVKMIYRRPGFPANRHTSQSDYLLYINYKRLSKFAPFPCPC